MHGHLPAKSLGPRWDNSWFDFCVVARLCGVAFCECPDFKQFHCQCLMCCNILSVPFGFLVLSSHFNVV